MLGADDQQERLHLRMKKLVLGTVLVLVIGTAIVLVLVLGDGSGRWLWTHYFR